MMYKGDVICSKCKKNITSSGDCEFAVICTNDKKKLGSVGRFDALINKKSKEILCQACYKKRVERN